MAKAEIQAVELVRRIRDEQAEVLKGRTEAEVLEFFRKARQAAREDARRWTAAPAPRRRQI